MNKNLILKFIYINCIKPFKLQLAAVSFVCFYWALDLTFRPYVTNIIIDKAQAGPIIIKEFIPLIFIYFCTMAFRFLVLRIYDFVWLQLKPALKVKIVKRLLNQTMQDADVFLQHNISSKYAAQSQELIELLSGFINTVFNNIVAHFSALIIALISFSYVHIVFTFLLIGISVCFLTTSAFVFFYGKRFSKLATNAHIELFSQIADIFNNIFSVKLFSNQKFESDRMNLFFIKFSETSKKKDFYYMLIHALQSFMFIIYQCACLIFAIIKVKSGEISAGSLYFILSMNRDIVECLWCISSDAGVLSSQLGGIENILEDLLKKEKIEIESKQDFVKNYNISFENVFFKYKGQKEGIFNDLNLKIKEGEKIGIVGHSGSGKSSLVNLLLKLSTPQKGIIKIGESDINAFDTLLLSSLFSVVTQDLSLFNRSLIDNIKYGKLNANEKEIEAAVQKAQLTEVIDNLENKYATIVRVKGANFSMGQRQRILIARAILKNAPIFIMDEYTSALDQSTQDKIQLALKEVMKDKTTIIIAHKISTLMEMDRVIVFDKGEIVQDAKPSELFDENGKYKNFTLI